MLRKLFLVSIQCKYCAYLRACQITQATPEPTPVPTILPDGVVVGVVIEQVIESMGEYITDAQGVADAVTAILAQDLVVSSSAYSAYSGDDSSFHNGNISNSSTGNSTFKSSTTNRRMQSNSSVNSNSSSYNNSSSREDTRALL